MLQPGGDPDGWEYGMSYDAEPDQWVCSSGLNPYRRRTLRRLAEHSDLSDNVRIAARRSRSQSVELRAGKKRNKTVEASVDLVAAPRNNTRASAVEQSIDLGKA